VKAEKRQNEGRKKAGGRQKKEKKKIYK